MKEILITLKKELVDNISISLSNIIYNIFAKYYETCIVDDDTNILVNFQNILSKLTSVDNTEQEKFTNEIIEKFNNYSDVDIKSIYNTLIKLDILLIYEQLPEIISNYEDDVIEQIINNHDEYNVKNITTKIYYRKWSVERSWNLVF